MLPRGGARTPFTYADYRLLPNDRRVELIGGDVLVAPAPGTGAVVERDGFAFADILDEQPE